MSGQAPDFGQLQVGDELPTLTFGPVTRHVLALYCGGSGDHNPIHVDSDFAQQAGLDDVIAHGMLSMAVLGRMVTEWIPQQQLRAYSARFMAITPVHATVTCSGRVSRIFEEDGERRLRLKLRTRIDDGKTTLSATATVALP
ncbi:MAG: MaoC/PaaZ C-terminal domain-containing protein [Xanthomonadales bacterium]|nr:MaoC/PaaZ C-terminal domain-containing protein [Xanthomonadales bacterium]